MRGKDRGRRAALIVECFIHPFLGDRFGKRISREREFRGEFRRVSADADAGADADAPYVACGVGR